MKRKQFTFYESFYRALKLIKDDHDRLKVYELICEYALYQEEPDLSGLSDSSAIAFELIRPTLDSAAKKAANGQLGGKQSGSKDEANDKQIEANLSKSKQTASKKEGEGEKQDG